MKISNLDILLDHKIRNVEKLIKHTERNVLGERKRHKQRKNDVA